MSESKKDFDFGRWVSDGFEGILGGRPRVSSPMTDEFKEHTRTAFREMLLAYRSLVDAVIEKTEKAEEAPTTRIKVE